MKVRDRIVADGIDDASFDPTRSDSISKREEVNRMADDPDTLFVDMRNHYEYEVGHFENAMEVPSDTFREQLPMAVDMLEDARDKNIVMYCTGGIRCEKPAPTCSIMVSGMSITLKAASLNTCDRLKPTGCPQIYRQKLCI